MNTIFELAREAACKSIFILALAAVVILCMPRATAATRHMVWLLAIVSLLVLPAFSLILPPWRVLPRWSESRIEPRPSMEAPWNVAEQPVMTAAAVTVARPAASGAFFTPKARFDWVRAAVWVWSGGAALALVVVLLGRLSLWRVARNSERVTDRSWLGLLDSLMLRLHFKRRVVLMRSARRRMPMTWGVLRPKVLVPREAEDWPSERRRVVLLHELAHVKRLDYLATMVTQVACAVYWFNPLVWLAARQLTAERERACDDLVISHGAPPADYAEQILELASNSSRFAACGAIAMARRSNLEGRLMAILDGKRNRAGTSRVFVLVAIALMGSIVVPIAMLGAAGEKRPDFGPVIERTVYDPDTQRTNALLDLDTGKLFSDGVLMRDQNTESLLTAIDTFLKFVRKEKIDLLGDASGHSVMGLDMVAVQVPNEQFESLHVEWLIGDKRLAARAQTETTLTPKEVPATYIFKTREGGRGILQIVRFNNHQNADIRYKVVASDAAHAAHGARPASSAGDQVARIRLQHAEQELERVTQLYKEKLVGREQLDQARANVELRRAELAGDEVEVSRVRLRQAEADLDRLTQLHAQKLVSGHELAQARLNIALRKAELDGDANAAARIRLQQAEQDFKRAADLWREKLMSGEEYQLYKQAYEIARAELDAGSGAESREYTIRKGETLERIATSNGVTAEALRRANPNVDWKRLKVGKKVLIPAPSTAPSAQ
jgi:beta-lactamase regulating signal transducer with metallopeptidase domain